MQSHFVCESPNMTRKHVYTTKLATATILVGIISMCIHDLATLQQCDHALSLTKYSQNCLYIAQCVGASIN